MNEHSFTCILPRRDPRVQLKAVGRRQRPRQEALEGAARRDFSVRVKEKMLLTGFVVLMMLMVTVIYNDLTRVAWIEALMPWR